ncbi:universal stress protein [Streptomyces flavofungini]|uniref:Universal stress protein n=1 Tax=Streptomyces flavofungini TaxID=68200 RepID=A0ABS0XIC0_9ACTN|nr:universal stress protein [Streptomyces flavofungini]MBJ3812659.1 universal stress protein [Streptomyces flavofungini]GHC89775.1 universal stress protein [Streptomyces flavofungini]
MRAVEQALIVGADGSEESLEAVDWAVGEAGRRGVPLRIVYASAWQRYEGHKPSFGVHRSPAHVFADHIVAQAVERAHRRAPAVKVSSDVVAEDPVTVLVRESATGSTVVVGSRGRGGLASLLLGSVSLSVAAHAPSPVIVVRGGEENRDGGFREVVVGIDEARAAGAAVAFAVRAAEARGAVLRAVHAWRCPAHEVPDVPRAGDAKDSHQMRAEAELDEALRAAVRDGTAAVSAPSVHKHAVEGHARAALLAASATADLLVVGARRRKGHVGMQLGAVNHAVLHHAACPVAVVAHT